MTAVRKKRGLTLSRRRAITGLLFVSPFILGFLIFYVRSLYMTIQFAFSETIEGEGLGYSLNFIGFDNFRFAFMEHASFRQTLTQSIIDMVVDVPLIIFFSLFMALLLNQKFRGRTVARAIFFLPVLLNAPTLLTTINTVQAMMIGGVNPASPEMVAAVSSNSGTMNIMYYVQLLGDIALPARVLEYLVQAVARINSIITSAGVQIIIFLAALQSISPSLYEVAKIEGATPYETFWKVTFPMVSPLLVTNMVYTVVDSFTRSRLLTLAYDTTFVVNNYSLGAVFSLVSMVCVCGILFIASAGVGRLVYYQN